MSHVPLSARILISAIFIVGGIGKISAFSNTRAFMESAGLPMAAVLLVIAIAVEILGGLSILLGFKTKAGASALALFLSIVSLIFHTNFADPMQQISFMQNMAIVGGLLYVASFGPGMASLDMKKMKK